MEIDLADRIVEQITSEYAITLGLTSGVEVRIETSLEISEPSREILRIDPQDLRTDRDLQRALVGRTVAHATADPASGSLEVAFDDGTALRVSPHADFEAWTVTWPDGAAVVSLPGGGLSEWGAQT